MTDLAPPRYLTVKELAALLRIKERKVYDLAASGEVPVLRATGKLLFPESEVQAWIEGARRGRLAGRHRPDVFLGSHDPLLDWALRQSCCGLATFFDGSEDGLARFTAQEGVAAGLHIFDPADATWNENAVAGLDGVLIGWATRRRGLVVGRDDGPVTSLTDLPGKRMAPRQAGSGTDTLFRHLAAKAGLPMDALVWTDTARSEHDAVLAVANGAADVTFGLEALADQFNLGFVPLIDERFDLLVDRHSWFDPPMQKLMAFCGSDAFTAQAARFKGYDLRDLGIVRRNG
jgi:excisionase family DNA binding protein